MYAPGHTPEQYFEKIMSLAIQYGKHAFDMIFCDNHKNHSLVKILVGEFPTAVKQIVFEFYYVLYLLLEEEHSIYYYYKERVDKNSKELFNECEPAYFTKLFGSSEKYKYVNFKDDTSHNNIQRNYKTFRKDMDYLAKNYYHIENIGLYKEIKDKYTSHKLTKLDYLFLERILDNGDVEFLFDSLREGRLTNNKKISNETFNKTIIPAITKLYEIIAQTEYCDRKVCKQAMLRSIDYYQFEKNCSIELSYMSAYALSKVKKSLDEKQRDREIFHRLRWTELVIDNRTHYIQNRAILLTKQVFNEYINGNMDAYTVRDVYAMLNGIIYIGLYNCLKSFFGGVFNRPLSSGYWLDIFQQDNDLKKELQLLRLDDFMCSDTELFFSKYFGCGQHINKKVWKEIKIKDFRELYKIL